MSGSCSCKEELPTHLGCVETGCPGNGQAEAESPDAVGIS